MLEPLFTPRSVLLTGISPEPGNLARTSLYNLRTAGYAGEIHLLGRKEADVFGIPIRTSFDDLPDGIDVAVVLTPARMVADTLDQCGRKGIRYAIVQSAGFAELGEEGARLADEVLAVARRHQIRFSGPNGLGVINPACGFDPVFIPMRPQWRPGGASVATQSGGMGLSYLWAFGDQNVGVARWVSMGNKLDLDEVDYVRFLSKDPDTRSIVLYLEGIARGRDLFEAIKASDKPVLVHKSGRTDAGARMAFSHTAALTGDDAVLSAMLAQAGAVRVESSGEVANLCKAFELPPVRGPRVAIISRSGGHAVVAADCAADSGFDLPPFSSDLLSMATGRQVIKRGNPLDLGDVFDIDLYGQLLGAAAADPGFDAVVLMFGYFPPFETETGRRLVPLVRELTERHGKPVVLALMSDEQELVELRRLHPYPYFESVEDAFRALRLSRDHQAYVGRRDAAAPDEAPPGTDRAAARVDAASGGCGGPVSAAEAFGALADAGIQVAPCVLARTAADLAGAPAFPVAAKVATARVVHKTDAGGVVLGIPDAAALAATFADFSARFGPFGEGEGVLVQSMAAPGVEVLVGGRRDPVFGPIVVVGLGGILVEVLHDTAIRLAPVSLDEARGMIASLKGAALFRGVRGRPPADVEALARIVHAVSHLLAATPRIAEIDLNPVLVHPQGATAVDVRILKA